jgi:hypothetical protein
MMPPEKREPLLETIEEMEMKDAQEEIAEKSDDAIAGAVDAEGGDAKAIGARGAALAQQLIERRKRLMWQVEAREKSAAARAALDATPKRPRGTRKEMVDAIEAARGDAEFATLLAARKGGTDEATDDELEDLLHQLDHLRARREKK